MSFCLQCVIQSKPGPPGGQWGADCILRENKFLEPGKGASRWGQGGENSEVKREKACAPFFYEAHPNFVYPVCRALCTLFSQQSQKIMVTFCHLNFPDEVKLTCQDISRRNFESVLTPKLVLFETTLLGWDSNPTKTQTGAWTHNSLLGRGLKLTVF